MADDWLGGLLVPVEHDPFNPNTLAAGATAISGSDPVLTQMGRNADTQQNRFSGWPTVAVPQQTSEGYRYLQRTEQPAQGPESPLAAYEYAPELSDPRIRDRLMAYTQAEVGGQGPAARQSFIEATIRRAKLEGKTIAQVLGSDYFPWDTHRRALAGVSGDQRALYDPMIDQALAGSNVSNWATGNASGTVGFAGGPRTATYGGERFGVEGWTLPAIREAMAGGELVPVDYDPFERAAVRTRLSVRPEGGRQQGMASELLGRFLDPEAIARRQLQWPGFGVELGRSIERSAYEFPARYGEFSRGVAEGDPDVSAAPNLEPLGWMTGAPKPAGALGAAGSTLMQPAEQITAAAVKVGDQLFTGPNHVAALENAEKAVGTAAVQDAVSARIGGAEVDGFLTNTGRFVGRNEGAQIAGVDKGQSQKIISEPLPTQHPARAPNFVPVEHDPFEAARISTRLPTGLKATENPLGTPRLTVGLSSMEPQQIAQAANSIKSYAALPPALAKGSPEQVVDNFINHVKDNLLWLYDHPEIAGWRDRAGHWYEGGNRMSHELADRYGTHPNSSAGALAILSPKTDWFQNASMGIRLHEVHFKLNGEPFSPDMAELGRAFYKDPVQKKLLNAIQGKTYGELTDPVERAAWYRLYERAHFSREFSRITPEGYAAGPVRTKAGEPAGIGTQSDENVAKAIQALESGGDPAKLTYIIGPRHKVRNFYNNLVAPWSKAGDVTIDTHAVAAGMLEPFGLNDPAVLHNFGPAPSSRATGSQGLYPIYAEAYRQAAAERGILPRQMQSITWEAVRGLFPDVMKTQQFKKEVSGLWRQYQSGVLSKDAVRSEIINRAGGFRPPDWHLQ